MDNQTKKESMMFFNDSKFVPNDTAKGLFLFLVSQTVITLIYQVIYMAGLTMPVLSYFFTLVLDGCFVYCVYTITKTKNLNFYESIKVKKAPSFLQVILCFIIAIVCMFGFAPITNLFIELLYSIGYTSVVSDVVIPNVWYYLLYVGFICIIPAIAEEILFRGLICSGLRRMGVMLSIFGSAFLFMIMHGSPDQTAHQFILGIVLAIVFLVTNNLWVPILIHFFNNFIAVTYSFIMQNMQISETAETITETTEIYLSEYVVYAIVYALVAASLLYLLIRGLINTSKRKPEFMEINVKSNFIEPENYNMSGLVDGVETNYATDLTAQENDAKVTGTKEQNADLLLDPVDKLSGSGKAMYVISVVWLVADWISALVVGLTQVI